MFFPKLRRRAKWVFLALALAFGLGFVAFGVGAGGSGIGDYIADLLNREPATTEGVSAEEARERLSKNPDDAEAQLALAEALQTEGKTEEAIAAFERYTALRPRDTDALQQLAALWDTKAVQAQERAAAAQVEAQATLFAADLRPTDSRLAQALGQDPITTVLQEETTRQSTAALTEVQEAYRQEAAVYGKLTKLLPEDPNMFYELGRSSQFAGDSATAVAAYEQFLRLAPDDPNAPLIREQLKFLRAQAGGG
jgi:tetratricopeptide (TPR) repeat protein